jgi:hypothetical protein
MDKIRKFRSMFDAPNCGFELKGECWEFKLN